MPGLPSLILLVEDKPEISTVISDILDDAGFRSEVASNYADGVVLLRASQPALLIADVRIPGDGDGHELAEVARRLGVPTLLVSGHPDVIAEAETGGHPFLAKPFQLSELQRVIRILVERDQPRPTSVRRSPS